MTLPSKERQYECIRTIADCYQNNNFDALYPLLSDNVKWFSQWEHNNKPIGKNNVIKYYKTREKDFEGVFCETQIVELIGNMNEDSKIIGHNNMGQGKVMFMYDDGKLCTYMTKYKDGIQYNTMIDPEYEGDKISSIGICEPRLYKFCSWTPKIGEQIDWGKGIPNYKETDIMRDEELCEFALEIVHKYFIKPEGYETLYSCNFLSSFPNFTLKKDGKTILLIVRGCGAPNMPTIEKIEKDYFIQKAKKQGLQIFFAPVSFGAKDPDRFEKGLLLRGDLFYVKFEGIEPLE